LTCKLPRHRHHHARATDPTKYTEPGAPVVRVTVNATGVFVAHEVSGAKVLRTIVAGPAGALLGGAGHVDLTACIQDGGNAEQDGATGPMLLSP
jgi:hypothetical protein